MEATPPSHSDTPQSAEPAVNEFDGAEPAVDELAGTMVLPEETRPACDQVRLAPLDLPRVEREHYVIEGEHARGGLGRILRGRDRRLDRAVAIKELLVADARSQVRFVREALVCARLQHPAIVPIYEAGRWPNGEPFYAMKMISGRSLREHITEARSLDARLALVPEVLAVADAMAYAHEQRVIHRDLKPSNILIGRFGETVVVDWGLAKDLSRPASAEEDEVKWDSPYGIATHDVTLSGSVLGTPQYMPLEQACGQAVDERADVYALGAILYHVLAGMPPYEDDRPGVILALLRTAPPLPLGLRQPGVPNDLVAIVSKAMARDPEQRYPSAKELAKDLHSFQNGQLVAAREYTRLALVGRWLRRYRLLVASLVILNGGGIFAVQRVVRERNMARQARALADRERLRAEAQRDRLILAQARGSLERDPTATIAALKGYPADGIEADVARELALTATASGIARHVFQEDPEKACYGDFSPDGKLFAVSAPGATLALRDIHTGALQIQKAADRAVYMVRFAAADDWLAYMPPESNAVHLWNYHTGAEQTRVIDDGVVDNFRFSPDGRWLLAGTDTHGLYLWSHPAGTRVKLPSRSSHWIGRFSADGRFLVLTTDSGVSRYDLASQQLLPLVRTRAAIVILALADDNRQLATATADGTIELWSMEDGRRLAHLEGHQRGVIRLAFSPDGRYLASGSHDRTVRLWDVAQGREVGIDWNVGPVELLAFSPDSRLLAWAGAQSSTVRVWNLETSETQLFAGHHGDIHQLLFSPDGRFLASSSHDKTTRLWALAATHDRVLRGHNDNVQDVAYSSDGQWFASADREGKVRLWDVQRGTLRGAIDHGNLVESVRFSPDSRYVASAGWDRRVRLWRIDTGEIQVLDGHRGLVWRLAFSPGSQWLASADKNGAVWLWPGTGGAGRLLLAEGAGPVHALAFSDDGRWLAASNEAGEVHLWRPATGTKLLLRGHQGVVGSIVFAPDNEHLASAGNDQTMRIWTLADGKGQVFGRTAGRLKLLRYTPDGRELISAGEEGSIRAWELKTGASKRLGSLATQIRALEVSRDGRWLAAGGADSGVWIWSRFQQTRLERVDCTRVGIRGLSFAPGSDILAVGGTDHLVHLWTLKPHPFMALHNWLDMLSTQPAARAD